MPRNLLRFLRSIVVIYLAVAALAYIFQRRLQYFPDSRPPPLPGGEAYRSLEEVTLPAADGLRLCAWYWRGTRPLTLVMFPGNGGNRGDRLEWLADLHRLGLGVFILDYRGYGGSEGSPSEAGLFLDAEAAWSRLQGEGAGKLVYYGESLGCGVAVELARRHPPAALILQSGFASAVDVAQSVYFFLPVRLLMKDRYENAKKLPEVSCPVLVIHGERDSIIPPRHGRALFEAAKEPKEWYPVPGADHNDLPWAGGREYLERLDAFLRQHVGV